MHTAAKKQAPSKLLATQALLVSGSVDDYFALFIYARLNVPPPEGNKISSLSRVCTGGRLGKTVRSVRANQFV